VCAAAYRAANREAISEYAAAWRTVNPEYNAAYYAENKEAISEQQAAYRAANKEVISEKGAAYYAANREAISEYKSAWAKANRGKRNSAHARRRAAKKQATPAWLTAEQLKQIEAIYKACPKGFHVDHIVPLTSDIVCGLHVPWNLQILPASENIRKGNRLVKT
jgi:hypothetical protein